MPPRRILDISQPVDATIGHWPGDTPFSAEFTWSMEKGAACNVSCVHTSPHNGTHADAPVHFVPGAAGIGEVPLDVYIGPCRVIDGPRHGQVLPEHLDGIDFAATPRVLVRTRDDDSTAFPSDFVTLSPAAAGLLVDRGARLIGLDTPSMDPVDSKSMASHNVLLPGGIAILENLALAHVEPGVYELVALPLRWMGLDASPVRAILRDLP